MSENVAFRVHSDIMNDIINNLENEENDTTTNTTTTTTNTTTTTTTTLISYRDLDDPQQNEHMMSALFSIINMARELPEPTRNIRFNRRGPISDILIERTVEESLNQSNRLIRAPTTNIDVASKKFSTIENSLKQKECSICTEDFKDNDDVASLPCNHLFHHACLLEWGHYNTVCPMCRIQLPTLNYEEIEME